MLFHIIISRRDRTGDTMTTDNISNDNYNNNKLIMIYS